MERRAASRRNLLRGDRAGTSAQDQQVRLGEEVTETIGTTAKIVFFLMGAMTIVEVIDAHDGFEIVTAQIRTRKFATLLWLIVWITFFLSAILDILTTTIAMVSLLQKPLDKKKGPALLRRDDRDRGKCQPSMVADGDVATTMLWIGGQVTATGIVEALFAASVVNLLLPLCIVTVGLMGRPFVYPSLHSRCPPRRP